MSQDCCCTTGHKHYGYKPIKNLDAFLKGALSTHSIYVWTPPHIELEYVCEKCKAIIRDTVELKEHAKNLVSDMGTEIAKLRKEIESLKKPKRDGKK